MLTTVDDIPVRQRRGKIRPLSAATDTFSSSLLHATQPQQQETSSATLQETPSAPFLLLFHPCEPELCLNVHSDRESRFNQIQQVRQMVTELAQSLDMLHDVATSQQHALDKAETNVQKASTAVHAGEVTLAQAHNYQKWFGGSATVAGALLGVAIGGPAGLLIGTHVGMSIGVAVGVVGTGCAVLGAWTGHHVTSYSVLSPHRI